MAPPGGYGLSEMRPLAVSDEELDQRCYSSAPGTTDQNLPESLEDPSNGLAALGTASSGSDDGFAIVEIAREASGKQ